MPARLMSLSRGQAIPIMLSGASKTIVRCRLMQVSWGKEVHRLISSSGRISRKLDSSRLHAHMAHGLKIFLKDLPAATNIENLKHVFLEKELRGHTVPISTVMCL